MSDELFEVTFSGQIAVGGDPEEVKIRVGKMFNADEAKMATLFSGKRIVIKKNIDHVKATKYKTAFYQAGAICEIKAMPATGAVSPASAQQTGSASITSSEQQSEPAPAPAPAPKEVPNVTFETGDWGEGDPPPQVDPLGITGDQIEDLDLTIAPIGAAIQDKIEETPEPQFDLSELDVAPVGSDISSSKKEPDPPPPDVPGITLAD